MSWIGRFFGWSPTAAIAQPAAVTAPAAAPAQRKRKRRTAPLTQSKTRWYLADLEQAIRTADGGDMSQAAKLYKALRRDGTIGGLLGTLTGGLVRMKRRFTGAAVVVAALEGTATERSLYDEMYPPGELALLAADGFVLGVGVGEMVDMICIELDAFGNAVETSPYKVLRRLEPEYLRYRWDEDRWYYASTTGLQLITPGDGRWLLHTAGGAQEPWNHGRWCSLGRGFIAKDHAYLHRENYAAKLANPARVAVSPQGASEGQKQSWWAKVMAWGVNSVFGVTPGYDVKLLESNGRGFEVFAAIIETSNTEFMIDIAGQVVTVTGGTGFANADIHATVRSDIIEAVGDALAYTINTQGIPPWAAAKFGADQRAQVSYDTKPAKNLKAEADSLTAAAGAITALAEALRPFGLEPDATAIANTFAIPIAGDLDGDALPDAYGGGSTDASNETAGAGESVLEDTAVADLAKDMTEFAVARCEHGRMNRCPLCGVERVRRVVRGPKGQPTWPIAWRPIGQATPAAAPAEQEQVAA